MVINQQSDKKTLSNIATSKYILYETILEEVSIKIEQQAVKEKMEWIKNCISQKLIQYKYINESNFDKKLFLSFRYIYVILQNY